MSLMYFKMAYSCMFMFVLLLGFLTNVRMSENTDVDDGCFCLKEMSNGVRTPIQTESTLVNGKELFLIAELNGMIQSLEPSGSRLVRTPYINLTGEVFAPDVSFEERGLLGFALHPEFATNGKIYTYSFRTDGGQVYAVVSEVANRDVTTERILLRIEQPGARQNGGPLVFGDDGYLYIFVGDGGPATEAEVMSQNTSSRLGKILRIDVNNVTASGGDAIYNYTIPADNPQNTGWLPEIYALGFRNPWKCWKDRGDNNGVGKGRIFCGEAGAVTADEIDRVVKGGNYGWNYKEGLNCMTSPADCDGIEDEVLPVYAFNRSTSGITTVVCGPVYRGDDFGSLQGRVIYGDFLTRKVFSLKEDGDGWSPVEFLQCNVTRCPDGARSDPRTYLLAFGQDLAGEMYLLVTDDPKPSARKGALLKIVQHSTTTNGGDIGPQLTFTLHIYTWLLTFLWQCLQQ